MRRGKTNLLKSRLPLHAHESNGLTTATMRNYLDGKVVRIDSHCAPLLFHRSFAAPTKPIPEGRPRGTGFWQNNQNVLAAFKLAEEKLGLAKVNSIYSFGLLWCKSLSRLFSILCIVVSFLSALFSVPPSLSLLLLSSLSSYIVDILFFCTIYCSLRIGIRSHYRIYARWITFHRV